MMTLPSRFTSDLRAALTAMTAVVVLVSVSGNTALAQGLGDSQRHISGDIAVIPKVIATIAYVIAAFFAATGLIKLKDWINDGDKNPINGALFRLVVASLLIVFPHVLVIINTTLFGSQENGDTMGVTAADAVKMQQMDPFKRSGK